MKISLILSVLFFYGSGMIPVSAQTNPGELSSDQFEDPLDNCKACHAEIYEQWNGSMHSLAEKDPYYQALFKMASEETDGLTDTYCSRCHTPIGLTSGEMPPVDASNMSEIALKGVQCDFCHSVSASDGTSNAQYILTPDGIKRGPFADSRSPAHKTEFSELHTKAEFCGVCHDVNHPTNGLPLEATYTEWKNGPYAAEGIQCQDCHMTPGITQYEQNPGKASDSGPNRDHIWTHYGVGGNAFMTDYLGSATHKDMAVERLQQAAELEIIPDGSIEPGETFKFWIKVKNVGAGHYLPTGLTESRQMWIDVRATNGDGQEIFRSGAFDEYGNIDEATSIFHTVLGDAEGHHTEKVWEAESILSDHRVPPKGNETERFSFKIPEDTATPISITATLKYRSAPQEMIDHLFGEGELEVPVIDMTHKSLILGEKYQRTPGFQLTLPVILGLIFIIYVIKGFKQ